MKITIAELRNYIRNALASAEADRKQVGSIGKRGELGEPHDFVHAEETHDDIEDLGKTVINDPYVTQDRPAPSVGHRKFGKV